MARLNAPPVVTQLNAQELRELTELPPEPSVSIYMTMYRSGPEVRQNPVRLKNLLRQAAEQLRGAVNGSTAARSLADELGRLVEQVDEIVAEPRDGLALLARDGFLRIYKMNVRFADLAMVASRLHLTPLVEHLQGDGRFFVLAASQNDVRLLEGDKHGLREIELDTLPKNLVDALNIDEYVRSLQFHTEGPGGRASIKQGGGIFHGHGGADQGDRKGELVLFFRALDNALSAHLRDDSAPLVFAGVDYLFPIYQSVNSYRGLADRAVAGNPEGWRADQLHGPAWEIVKSRFEADRAAAVDQYGLLADRRQASDVLLHILDAARIGRVGTLLVARGARELGVVDPESGQVSLTDADAAESEDLIALAAARTIGASGQVYLLDPAEMPTESPIAALYRY